MDLVRIKGLELDCIVGVRPHEREREQRIHIDLALGLDLAPAGRSGRIGLTCDYDRVAEELIAMLRFRRYHLIEMATEELAAMLFGVHEGVETVEIHLDKPAALDGRARAGSVEVHRKRADFPVSSIELDQVRADVLLTTRDAGLYRFRLAPDATLAAPALRGHRELEWTLAGSTSSDDAEAPFRLRDTEHRPGMLVAGNEGAEIFRCVLPPLRGSSPVGGPA